MTVWSLFSQIVWDSHQLAYSDFVLTKLTDMWAYIIIEMTENTTNSSEFTVGPNALQYCNTANIEG